MTSDLGAAMAVLCLVTGCCVRSWRWITGQHSPRGKQKSSAVHQVRVAVRRPAIDVPVESDAAATRPNDDPLLQ